MLKLLLLMFLLIDIALCYKHKHRNEWYRHPQCNYCNNENIHSNSSELVNNYIVDIFLLIKINNEYQYLSDGAFWYVPKIIKAYDNDIYQNRIHIITNSLDIIERGTKEGYYMYNMESLLYKPIELEFYRLYVNRHNSFNKIDYEFLCFYRWILYKQIITHWNNNITDINLQIHRVLSIDSDILFYMNPSKFFYDVINSLYYNDHVLMNQTTNYYSDNITNILTANNESLYNYELVVLSRGAVQMFTSSGLIAYANYVYDFYNRSIEVVSNITNTSAVLFYNFKVFSDMQLIELFCNENKYKRNICYEEISVSKYNTRSIDQNCLVERLGCIPLGNIFAVMSMKKYSLFYKDKNFYGFYDKLPYCFIHFQGDIAKGWFEFFLRYQSRLLNLNYDNERLLIQAASKAQVFYIDSSGYRRSFGSFDLFLAFNFTDDDIVKHLPIYLVDSLPLGNQLNINDDLLVANNL